MPMSEQDKAALSKKRGQAAALISDPEMKKKFISAQGDAEQKGKGEAKPEEYDQMSKSADDTLATGGMNTWVKPLGSFKKGTKSVPKTGPYVLHEGEKVVPEKDNPDSKKGEKMAATPFDMITGGKKAPKTIAKHEYHRTHNGKHVVTHKHHDSSHKDEQHMFEKFSDAADHMEQNPPQPEPQEAAPAAGAPAAGAAPGM